MMNFLGIGADKDKGPSKGPTTHGLGQGPGPSGRSPVAKHMDLRPLGGWAVEPLRAEIKTKVVGIGPFGMFGPEIGIPGPATTEIVVTRTKFLMHALWSEMLLSQDFKLVGGVDRKYWFR